MGKMSEESRGGEETKKRAGMYGRRGQVGLLEDRRTADSHVLPVREARAVEREVIRRIVPGGWRILFGDTLVVKML